MKKLLFMVAIFLLLSVGVAQAQDDWQPITPGATAVCARGTPYTFFVRNGDPTRLLIFFEGGGACWNDGTCKPGSGTFSEVVHGDEMAAFTQGIFDVANPQNPLAGYTVVFVTYCTGDYHLGTQAVDYPSGTVNHVGSIDATAAINWAFANIKKPSQVVVAGCSAGAIGSIYYAPTIARHYRGAALTQFGDAGVGVINPGWGGFSVWGADLHGSPDQVVNTLYSRAATSYPRDRFAEYTSYNDSVQTSYYVMMGAVMAWPLAMESSLTGLQKYSNFRSYIGPSDDHCISTTPRFYSEAVNGVAFRDWFAGLVDGSAVDNVTCTDC